MAFAVLIVSSVKSYSFNDDKSGSVTLSGSCAKIRFTATTMAITISDIRIE